MVFPIPPIFESFWKWVWAVGLIAMFGFAHQFFLNNEGVVCFFFKNTRLK